MLLSLTERKSIDEIIESKGGETKSITNNELPAFGTVLNGTMAKICNTEDRMV